MISVIIPAWNEERNLPRTIESLRGDSGEWEGLVVDGGSSDGTMGTAKELGFRVLSSPQRNRAMQMNLGASEASGSILWFLHADTLVPPGALQKIRQALLEESVVGGAFARRFDSPSPVLKLTCWAAEVRNRIVGWHLGDQGIFCRKSVFQKIGGYKPLHRFEDLDFSRRLGQEGQLVTLRPPVLSSARRFAAAGPAVRTWRDFLLTVQYLRGDPNASHDQQDCSN